jgi:hypothetical protein
MFIPRHELPRFRREEGYARWKGAVFADAVSGADLYLPYGGVIAMI